MRAASCGDRDALPARISSACPRSRCTVGRVLARRPVWLAWKVSQSNYRCRSNANHPTGCAPTRGGCRCRLLRAGCAAGVASLSRSVPTTRLARSSPSARIIDFSLGSGFSVGWFAAGEFGLGVGELLQRGVPFGFQAAGDQAVVGVDGAVAAFGPAGPVSGCSTCRRHCASAASWPSSRCSAAARQACSAAGCSAARNASATAVSIVARRRAGGGCRGPRRAGRCRCSSSRGWFWPGRRNRRASLRRPSRRWPGLAARAASRTAPVPGWRTPSTWSAASPSTTPTRRSRTSSTGKTAAPPADCIHRR